MPNRHLQTGISDYPFYSKDEIITEITTSTARMRLLSNNIIHYTYFRDSYVDVAEHIDNHNALVKIARIAKHPLLIDAFDHTTISSDARNLIRSLEPITPILARAIVTESLALKLIISFFKNINKAIYPLEVFNNYEKAKNWLLRL